MTKNEKHAEPYLKSLKDFANGSDKLVEEYKSISIKAEELYIVRLHKYVAQSIGGILVPDLSGNIHKSTEFFESRLGPAALIVKAPDSGKYKEGDLVVLSSEKLRGEIDNPVWQLYEQAMQSKGVEAIEPEDKRKKIPLLEYLWKDNMFVRPWLYEAEEEDRLTYMLNDYEIKGVWEL